MALLVNWYSCNRNLLYYFITVLTISLSLFQINHITVTSDRDPLDLCNRLLHNASTLVTLLIRRPVLSYETGSTGGGLLPNARTMTSNSAHTLSMIHQTPSTNDARKASTIGRFALVGLYMYCTCTY